MHARGVVHGDVTPQRLAVCFDAAGRLVLKVADGSRETVSCVL